jgi:glycosyltransferase involved in cell wall biosynthesis
MSQIVSVVVPVWNRRELIGGAIDSVLVQELPPEWRLELIVVDDGSDDGTEDFLDALVAARGVAEEEAEPAEPARSIRVVHTPHRGFPGAARNRGVRESSGELLAFLDSDDRWLPGKLRAQIPLHHPGEGGGSDAGSSGEGGPARISHTREIWMRNGREVSQRTQRHRRSGNILTDALVKCIVGPSTVMIDRDLYGATGGFREDLEVAEDYEYWLRILATTPIAYLDQPLTVKQAGQWEQLSEKYGEIEGFRIAALRNLVVSGYFDRCGNGGAGGADDDAGDAGGASVVARRELARKLRVYAAGARKRGRSAEAVALEEEADTFENSTPDL